MVDCLLEQGLELLCVLLGPRHDPMEEALDALVKLGTHHKKAAEENIFQTKACTVQDLTYLIRKAGLNVLPTGPHSFKLLLPQDHQLLSFEPVGTDCLFRSNRLEASLHQELSFGCLLGQYMFLWGFLVCGTTKA